MKVLWEVSEPQATKVNFVACGSFILVIGDMENFSLFAEYIVKQM
jgi:hypothetical protein